MRKTILVACALSIAAKPDDIRVMLSDVASAKACEMIRGQFRGLRAPDRPGVVTGVLWIRQCAITNEGERVHFELAGEGWQWAEQEKRQAGGRFDVHQYVKFGVKVALDGSLDLAYDQRSHIVSMWFTPSRLPEVAFAPIGKVSVDARGAWSHVIGNLSTVFSDSPDTQGTHEAKRQGTRQFMDQLAGGLAVAIDLCSGFQRFTLGRPPKGSLGPADVGETPRVPVELAPRAMFVFGPELAGNGMTIDVDAPDGAVDVALACAERADAAADAYAHGRPDAASDTLARKTVDGHARLHVGPQRCKVAVIARSATLKKAMMSWQRPAGEQAYSTGGPVMRCVR